MTDDTSLDGIRSALVGGSGMMVNYPLLLAVQGLVGDGPDAAFAVRLDDNRQTVTGVHWVQGGAIGELVEQPGSDPPIVTGVVRPASAVWGVTVNAVVRRNHFERFKLARNVTVTFAAGDDVSVNTDSYQSDDLRGRADQFIDRVLDLVRR